MYPRPIVPHGFNHQSYYRQPVLNLRPINQIVWNGNQNQQQMGLMNSSSFSSVHNHSLASKPANVEHSIRLALTNHTQPQIERRQDLAEARKPRKPSNDGVHGPHGNGSKTNEFAASASTGYVLDQKSNNGVTTNGVSHRRPSSRMESLGPESSRTNGNSTSATPLSGSRSAGALNDYIQRERRAHTMAPLTRIVGPSSTPTASLFASTVAPSDAKAMKSAQQNQSKPDATASTLSKPMAIRNDATTDDTDATADDYDDDADDDETPIIVKVRYDPDAGAPPSEDLIRQAVNNRLKGSSGPRTGNDPLIFDFRNDTVTPSAPQMPTRQQQPDSPPSRSIDAAGSLQGSLSNTISSRQQQPTQPNPQLLQRQRQFLQEQQQRQQHPQALAQQQKQQEQQRQQQHIFMQRKKHQEQERQQYIRLMEEKQRQQQLLRQQQLEQQQKLFVQQQKEKQQLEQFLQQQKQQQLRQRLQQEQLQKQQQQLKDYQMQQQRYREQLLRQQQYEQNQQRLQPQSDRVYQQNSQSTLFESQRNQQNPYLPPMSARPPQGPSTGRSFPIVRPPSIFVPTARLPSMQMFPRAPLSYTNPPPVQNITTERLPVRNIKPGLNNSHSHTGLATRSLNSLSNYAQKYIGSTFIPINFQVINGQPSIPMNGHSSAAASNHIPQRPHTAPSSAEIYRPTSALDVPELSQDNLRNMLSQMPGLGGRQFSFEYVPPTQTEGYQMPIGFNESLNKYPEAVIVDQLPKNVIRHVQSSNNQALLAALNHSIPPETNVPSSGEKINRVVTSHGALHHKQPTRSRVKQSLPSSVDDLNSTRQPSSTESNGKHTRATTHARYRSRTDQVK